MCSVIGTEVVELLLSNKIRLPISGVYSVYCILCGFVVMLSVTVQQCAIIDTIALVTAFQMGQKTSLLNWGRLEPYCLVRQFTFAGKRLDSCTEKIK